MSGSALELNLTPHDLLTPDDMVSLTGATRPDLQAKVLAANNIFFMIDQNLIPKTTWFHVNNPIHLRTPTLSMSDFGYGFQKSFQLKRPKGSGSLDEAATLQNKIYSFIDKVFKGVDAKIPENIREQIAQNEKHQKDMALIAEMRRREREEK